jgi:hypothetical protein
LAGRGRELEEYWRNILSMTCIRLWRGKYAWKIVVRKNLRKRSLRRHALYGRIILQFILKK